MELYTIMADFMDSNTICWIFFWTVMLFEAVFWTSIPFLADFMDFRYYLRQILWIEILSEADLWTKILLIGLIL